MCAYTVMLVRDVPRVLVICPRSVSPETEGQMIYPLHGPPTFHYSLCAT